MEQVNKIVIKNGTSHHCLLRMFLACSREKSEVNLTIMFAAITDFTSPKHYPYVDIIRKHSQAFHYLVRRINARFKSIVIRDGSLENLGSVNQKQ